MTPKNREVDRCDELKLRGVDRSAADARDRDDPVLERLAQRLERRALELGQLVEQQHAVWASVASPRRAVDPPPTIAGIDAL